MAFSPWLCQELQSLDSFPSPLATQSLCQALPKLPPRTRLPEHTCGTCLLVTSTAGPRTVVTNTWEDKRIPRAEGGGGYATAC
jgi:hypothetical protein